MRLNNIGKWALAASMLLSSLPVIAAGSGEGQVRKLELQPGKQRTMLLITHSGEGKFRLFKSEKQGSVIIEAENLVIPPALTRLVDVSGGEGPVMQMTPYNSQHSGHAMAKLVLQLRGGTDVSSTDLPGKFLVEIAKKAGLPANAKSPAPFAVKDEVKAHLSAAQKSEEIAKKLIDVLSQPQEEKKYFGSKVTFEAKDAEVPDIFRLVGESSELNIIWDPDVEGQKTSLAVKDLPWDQLLDIVIQQKGYKATVMGNVVRIMSIDTFNKQAESKKKEITLTDELEPIIMSVIPLGFTQAIDMKKLISELIQEKSGAAAGAVAAGGGGGGAAGALTQDFKRGRLEVDDRTNSLVVTNTKDSIERIRRLVKELDVPVPQVLIDSKIIIATENFTKTVGTSWKFHLQGERQNTGPIGVFNQQSESLSGGESGQTVSNDFQISSTSPGDSVLGIGFGASSRARILAALELSEINGQSKTVASPRVIVNNNQTATISDGSTLQQLVAGGAGQAATLKPQLSLTVQPQVTSHGSIQLKGLTITKDAVNNFGVTTASLDNKSIKTDVLVDSGATLVLGGIYQMNSNSGRSGIPVLMDLPFIGQLFRVDTGHTDKSELMVFITPQIIDPEAGSQAL
ncbi:MAG: type IV pilus secretin PilQ [Bdellovibrionota bacterium]